MANLFSSFSKFSIVRGGSSSNVPIKLNATRSFGSSILNYKMARSIETMNLRMLLMGPPGSGKGTHSQRIQQDFGLIPISSGNLLRRHIEKGTSVGKVAMTAISNGELLSDDLILYILEGELQKLKEKSWLLDGFPRNLQQAKTLETQLQRSRQQLNLVINLNVSEDIILERISERWVHVPSGRVYNTKYNPPKEAGLDDITGEKLVQREDDNPEVFRKRLVNYKQTTLPVLEYYDQKNILVTLSGNSSDVIYPQLKELLAQHLFSGGMTIDARY